MKPPRGSVSSFRWASLLRLAPGLSSRRPYLARNLRADIAAGGLIPNLPPGFRCSTAELPRLPLAFPAARSPSKNKNALAGTSRLRGESVFAVPGTPSYFFFVGGKFFSSFATAFWMFFCCFSGFAVGLIVLLAVPRHTSSFFPESYMSSTSVPM